MECILHKCNQYNAIAIAWIPVFGVLKTRSHCVVLASMELIIRLSKLQIHRERPTSVSQKFWDKGHLPPCLTVTFYLFFNLNFNLFIENMCMYTVYHDHIHPSLPHLLPTGAPSSCQLHKLFSYLLLYLLSQCFQIVLLIFKWLLSHPLWHR